MLNFPAPGWASNLQSSGKNRISYSQKDLGNTLLAELDLPVSIFHYSLLPLEENFPDELGQCYDN